MSIFIKCATCVAGILLLLLVQRTAAQNNAITTIDNRSGESPPVRIVGSTGDVYEIDTAHIGKQAIPVLKYLADMSSDARVFTFEPPQIAPGANPALIKRIFGDLDEQLGIIVFLDRSIPVNALVERFGEPTDKKGKEVATTAFRADSQPMLHAPSGLPISMPDNAGTWVYGDSVVLLVSGDTTSQWGIKRKAMGKD